MRSIWGISVGTIISMLAFGVGFATGTNRSMKRQLNVPIPGQWLQSLLPQNPPLILHVMKHEDGHERGYLLSRTSSDNDGTAFETITSDFLKIDRQGQNSRSL